MRKRTLTSARQRAEQGYALLLVVFMTTLLLLATMVAAPSVRTERKREQEEEMIWRGKQYVRAIKLYYRKNGRFPTSLDDLTKPKTGSLRFLRQAYKDPMNKADGSWRLIYVGPAGQLIGSLKPPQKLQMQGAGQPGTPAAALGNQGSDFTESRAHPAECVWAAEWRKFIWAARRRECVRTLQSRWGYNTDECTSDLAATSRCRAPPRSARRTHPPSLVETSSELAARRIANP